MIDFEVGLESFDFNSLAEFSPEDGPKADSVARFGKDGDGIDGQQLLGPGDPVRQVLFLPGGDLDDVAGEGFVIGKGARDESLSQVQFVLGAVLETREHQERIVPRDLHGFLQPLYGPLQSFQGCLGEPLRVQATVRHGQDDGGNSGALPFLSKPRRSSP